MQINLNSGSWDIPDGAEAELEENLLVVRGANDKLIAAFPEAIVEPGSLQVLTKPKK
jgi:hypothetical protein